MVLSLPQFLGLFNIIAGLMLTLSILLLGTGIIMWFVRLGTVGTYRSEAIDIMMWAVGVLFTLILMLLLVRFFQDHTAQAMYILGFIIIGALVYFGVTTSGGGVDKDAKEEH